MAHPSDASETRTLHPLAFPARLSDPGAAELRRGLYVDCETTGFSPEHDALIELALLPFTYTLAGTVVEVLHDEAQAHRNDPGRPLPAEIREAQNSVGSGGKSMLRAVCVADVEEPGIPALELRPESLVEHRTTNSNRWMPSQPIASWTTPCSSRNVMESGTRTRSQIIGLIPSSRTLSRTIAPGSAADFTDSMTENCALPRDSIKIDPTEFCASPSAAQTARTCIHGVEPTLVSPAAKFVMQGPSERSCRGQSGRRGSRGSRSTASRPRSRVASWPAASAGAPKPSARTATWCSWLCSIASG